MSPSTRERTTRSITSPRPHEPRPKVPSSTQSMPLQFCRNKIPMHSSRRTGSSTQVQHGSHAHNKQQLLELTLHACYQHLLCGLEWSIPAIRQSCYGSHWLVLRAYASCFYCLAAAATKLTAPSVETPSVAIRIRALREVEIYHQSPSYLFAVQDRVPKVPSSSLKLNITSLGGHE